MANVIFNRLTSTAFAALATKDNNSLYFLTDTGMLFRGDEPQGHKVSVVAALPETPVKGMIYKNSPDGSLKLYNGTSYDVLFEPVTIATTISSESTNTTAAGALAVYNYITSAMGNVGAGLGGRLHPAVQDATALAGISGVQDKDLVLVEDAGAIFRYDAESTATVEAGKVVASTVEGQSGRWLKLYTSIDTSGLLQAVTGATAGNLPTLTADGTLTDSGKSVGGDTLDEDYVVLEQVSGSNESDYGKRFVRVSPTRFVCEDSAYQSAACGSSYFSYDSDTQKWVLHIDGGDPWVCENASSLGYPSSEDGTYSGHNRVCRISVAKKASDTVPTARAVLSALNSALSWVDL